MHPQHMTDNTVTAPPTVPHSLRPGMRLLSSVNAALPFLHRANPAVIHASTAVDTKLPHTLDDPEPHLGVTGLCRDLPRQGPHCEYRVMSSVQSSALSPAR